MLESWCLVMNKYIPFLKFKQNEIMALRELSSEIKEEIVPFFDFPRKNNMTELDFIGAVSKMEKRLARHLDGIDTFYLDDYDIEEDLFIDGADSYKYLIESFPNMIPVLGIDRSSEHNDTVFSAKENGLESPNVALRLTFEDFESFELVESDIEDFLGDTIRIFDAVDLIFDCRYTGGMNENIVSIAITDFANLFSRKFTTNNNHYLATVSCSGGMIGYIPTAKAINEGGYEVDRCLYMFGQKYRYSVNIEDSIKTSFKKLFNYG